MKYTLALLFALLGCREVTRTEYPSGWTASVSLVVDSGAKPLFIALKDTAAEVFAGDSACLKFTTDGNVHDVIVWWNIVYYMETLAWVPTERIRHVSYRSKPNGVSRDFVFDYNCR